MTLIATWNVNGLRSILKKNFAEYLKEYSPDIVCLQEIKARLCDVEGLMENIQKEYEVVLNPAIKLGYSGTAFLIKKQKVFEKNKYILKMGLDKFDSEGRFSLCETQDFYLINGYFPNGQRDHSRVDYKLEYSFAVLDYAKKLEKNKPVIITGDINTAHCEIDLKNPKSNVDSTGFLPIEREYIDQLIENNYSDVYRTMYPKEVGAFTWWSYRSNCREKNIGWRLDYFFVNQNDLTKIKSIKIMNQVLGSDHCPVHLEIEL